MCAPDRRNSECYKSSEAQKNLVWKEKQRKPVQLEQGELKNKMKPGTRCMGQIEGNYG